MKSCIPSNYTVLDISVLFPANPRIIFLMMPRDFTFLRKDSVIFTMLFYNDRNTY